MKARHIALCLALSLLGAGLQAQDDLPQVFSPNAAELGKYGKIPVSYFNGLPNISIPLTELKAKGYTLPVYLTYHASGNKPDQHPGWVGLGWTLHAGGCINRIVNGMKDEMSKVEYSDIHSVEPTFHPGYYFHAEAAQQIDWDDPQVRADSLLYASFFDWDPDEFQICLDDIQASFYSIGNGEFRIVSKSAADFKVEAHLANGANNPVIIYPGPETGSGTGRAKRYYYFDRFILTSSDGTKYVFGGNDSAIEYSMPLIPQFYGDQNTNLWKCRATANTWLLSRIERPDGEVVSFSYAKDGTPIVRHDAHHFEVCLYSGNPPLGSSYDTMDYPYQLRNISYCLIQPSYLRSITCQQSPDSLVFSRTQTNELRYATTPVEFAKRAGDYSYPDASGPYYTYDQISAEDYYMQLSSITGQERDIRFTYSSDTTRRLTLQQVAFHKEASLSDHRYTFDYDLGRLPAYHARQSDAWGFYNGISYAGMSYPQMAQVRSQVDPTKARAEMLTSIHYPTGGYTEFDYEGHTYSKEVAQVIVDLLDNNADAAAGGLRIRTLRDYPAVGQMEERLFSYETDDGLSSGILAGSPLLYITGHCSRAMHVQGVPFGGNWVYDGGYSIGNEYPIRPLSTTDGNHVTYSQVRETSRDGSYSLYRYTNHDLPSCCDSNPLWRGRNTDSLLFFNAFNSKELFRGLLLQKSDYDRDGCLVREELNEYNIDTSKFIKAMNIEKVCDELLASYSYQAIYTSFPHLKRKVEKNYSDIVGSALHIETTEYTYDDHRRLKETKRTVGGAQERETITYTGDYDTLAYAGMKVRNMTAYPVEHLKFRKDTVDEKVVSAELTTWKHSDSLFVPAAKYRASLGSGVPLDTTGISGFRPFRKDTMDVRYGDGPELAFTKYDVQGNLVLSKDRDGLSATYEWTPDGCHPAAIFTGAARGYEYRDSSDVIRYQQNDLHVGSRLVKDFESIGPFSMTLDLTCPQGQNWYLDVIIDGNSYPVTVINSSYTQSVWSASHYGQYPSTRQVPIPAGTHRLNVLVRLNNYYAVQGSDPIGCSLMFTYAEKQCTMVHVPGQTAVFEDFEVDGNHTADAFHSGRSHVGPWNCPLDSDDDYIMDYRVYRDGRWNYVRQAVSGSTASINEGAAPIDHVRVYPAGSLPESYTWDDAGNLLSRTDSRGVTESYRYDGLGRLVGAYDNEGKKVEGYEYNYQNR